MGRFADIIGVIGGKLQFGFGGPQLKANSTSLEARNAADSGYARLNMALAAIYGNDFILNAGATSSGADWKVTVTRPSTGMSHDLQLVLPSADPSVGQALSVASFASGVITLQWTTLSSGAQLIAADTTTLVFGTSSPLAMYTAPAGAVHYMFNIIIDTAFDGAPSASIGITGTASKYVGSTQIDLTQPAGTLIQVCPTVAAPGGTENLICTYSAGGATVGSARLLGFYSVPS